MKGENWGSEKAVKVETISVMYCKGIEKDIIYASRTAFHPLPAFICKYTPTEIRVTVTVTLRRIFIATLTSFGWAILQKWIFEVFKEDKEYSYTVNFYHPNELWLLLIFLKASIGDTINLGYYLLFGYFQAESNNLFPCYIAIL